MPARLSWCPTFSFNFRNFSDALHGQRPYFIKYHSIFLLRRLFELQLLNEIVKNRFVIQGIGIYAHLDWLSSTVQLLRQWCHRGTYIAF